MTALTGFSATCSRLLNRPGTPEYPGESGLAYRDPLATSTAIDNSPSSGLVKGLGLFDSTTLVMGSMIGSGVFIVAADVSRQVQSPGLFFLTWVISGLMTVIAAISYGELAGMMPKAGGQYVYLREAFGPLFGFLYGWTLFLVIQTGTVAAVAVAFGKVSGRVRSLGFGQNHSAQPWDSRGFRAPHCPYGFIATTHRHSGVVFPERAEHFRVAGRRRGSKCLHGLKSGSPDRIGGARNCVGFWPSRARSSSAQGFWQGAHWDLATLTLVSVALVGPLFSSDAWNNVTFTGSEVINPKRNLPLALLVGTTVVCVIYFACNWAYYRALPFFGMPHGGLVGQGSNTRRRTESLLPPFRSCWGERVRD
jgi:basic amino acid/polyamine antiporter, APA family